ncbi:hypothetical protein Scep_000044 [Stephania cephalantha]|uniref:Thioester reductase (TE) domain-containing protein n=1 Tax=Stephania cephalantha TaxID=152367 RepID=A0AAP0L6U9_9MAGN
MDVKETMCVTGAGGYQASWVVKLLLSHGYKVDLVKPAVEGTSNVLKACTKAKVKRVVMVSSVAAVVLNPNWPKDQLMDETCWTDKDLCVANHETKAPGFNWYSLAKTEAESLALEYAKENGLEKMEYFDWTAVDVRDVAEALLMLYRNLEAKGRYICSSYSASTSVLIEKLRSLYPNHNYPKQISGEGFVYKLSSEKLRKLGWKNRPLEETLVDTIEDYYEKGLLNKP